MLFRNLHSESEIFIYCGHGSGDKFIDTQKLRKFKIPTSMLWGCSSGKLISHGIHDPQGAAINSLLGGAKFVIGNLWDVTDKDIDKYSIKCMDYLFDNSKEEEHLSPGEAVYQSRDACKLQYIVGCSPIIYGLPADIMLGEPT